MMSKKAFGILAVLVSFMLVFAVSVSSQSTNSNAPQRVLEKIANKTGSDPSGLSAKESNLSRITSSSDVYGSGVKVYEIQGASLGNRPVTAITAGGSKKPKPSGIDYTRSILSFGYAGNASGSEFLETSAGVQTSLDSGVVMMRGGSITGISTSIDDGSDAGNMEVKIYKNGNEVGLRNSFESSSSGVKVDVDRQSQDIVKFERGDVLSVEVSTSDGNSWSNAITSVETTTE